MLEGSLGVQPGLATMLLLKRFFLNDFGRLKMPDEAGFENHRLVFEIYWFSTIEPASTFNVLFCCSFLFNV